MATAKQKSNEMDTQEELVRLIAIQIRRSIGNQREAILELNRAGFGPTRISQLLGTTAGTVNTELKRAKKKPAKKPSL